MTQTDNNAAGERTRVAILETGLRLWQAGVDPTGRRIATELDLSHAAVAYHFPGHRLRSALAYHAVKTGNSRVIVQLIGEKNAAVASMSEAECISHLRHVRALDVF